VLVDCEKQLGNLCFWVNFQLLFDIVWLAHQAHVACNVVFDDIGLCGNCQLEVKQDFVGAFLLFFQLRVNIKEKFVFSSVLAGSFSV